MTESINNKFLKIRCSHRQWWVSVEFSGENYLKRDYTQAINGLSKGESYDLLLANGKTLHRGLFEKNKKHFKALLDILPLIQGWKELAVYVSGQLMTPDQVFLLSKIIKCAFYQSHRRCRSNSQSRWQQLGCHLPKCRIGLLGFNFHKCRNPYWFSFFQKADEGSRSSTLFVLNKKKLKESLCRTADLCPHYPEEVFAILEKLPDTLDLSNYNEFHMWTQSKRNVYVMYRKHFKTLVPRNPMKYEKWAKELII